MRDFDITPEGQSTPLVTLYGDALTTLPRAQLAEAERLDVVLGGQPASSSEGLEPGTVEFRGAWIGSDAPTLASRLRTILDDPSVTTVSVQAVDENDNLLSSPYNGVYRLDGKSRVKEPPAVSTTATADLLAQQYRIKLTEVDV